MCSCVFGVLGIGSSRSRALWILASNSAKPLFGMDFVCIEFSVWRGVGNAASWLRKNQNHEYDRVRDKKIMNDTDNLRSGTRTSDSGCPFSLNKMKTKHVNTTQAKLKVGLIPTTTLPGADSLYTCA